MIMISMHQKLGKYCSLLAGRIFSWTFYECRLYLKNSQGIFTQAFRLVFHRLWEKQTNDYCSLNRIDMNAVEGQNSRLSVILRGTESSRLVQCFSSHPEELQVNLTDWPWNVGGSTSVFLVHSAIDLSWFLVPFKAKAKGQMCTQTTDPKDRKFSQFPWDEATWSCTVPPWMGC